MKKLLLSILAIATLAFTSCGDDDNEQIAATCNDGILNNGETEVDCGGPNCQACIVAVAPSCTDGIMNGDEEGVDCGGSCPNSCADMSGMGEIIEISDNITSDTTWEAANIYQLNGRIAVESGATLTIEPGTLIKGSAGQGTNASALVIARGAILNAMGTEADPIIMTSTADNITIGENVSPNLSQNDRGLWGGLIILGAAPISVADNSGTAQIEGIPATDINGNYGGTAADDSSGTITYISVRHGGTNIGDGNEINGVTLGGVGSGTTFENIEVIANVDDGIEFFGGTVNGTNLIVWAQGDDAIDIDQAYSGTLDNVVVVQGGNSDHALEIDGPEGNATGEYTLMNATLFGLNENAQNGEIADFRSGATGANNNIFVTGFTGTGDNLQLSDVELDAGDDDDVTTISDNFTAGTLSFMNWEVVLPTGVAAVSDIFNERLDPPTTTFETAAFATAVMDGAETVGADTTVFSWTITAAESAPFQ